MKVYLILENRHGAMHPVGIASTLEKAVEFCKQYVELTGDKYRYDLSKASEFFLAENSYFGQNDNRVYWSAESWRYYESGGLQLREEWRKLYLHEFELDHAYNNWIGNVADAINQRMTP